MPSPTTSGSDRIGIGSPAVAIIQPMHEPPKDSYIPNPIRTSEPKSGCDAARAEKVLCERCGAEMFRMHAVWRCPQCRFKTDCCGW